MTSTQPEPRIDVDWWKDRHEEKLAEVKAASGDCRVLFVGDSITHSWEDYGAEVWQRYYAPRGAFNLGFSGDRTQHLLWRLQNGELGALQPEVIVLLIGTNNTGHVFQEAEETAAGVEAVVEQLRQHAPAAKLLLLAIFPRGGTVDDPLRVRNAEVNERIQSLADGERVRFLDVGDGFLHGDGSLRDEIMPDLLHPREEGYRLWAAAMEPTLAEMLGDEPLAPMEGELKFSEI
ncbi:platelet-activating factor acetylhydrolase IB subunit [Sulfuriroseicoccus oceanibius]|uniref:GDSL family lipase n=1 Tax=Sulfuriroseicoccus oceanibius TaxID=2707525 RepID=A0A6B3L9T2_9BACT|nr:platelet-activating factor acetylhydrolase IB subunit [Sulfuriroseicoccus oceanibius]QQL45508.1 GDSL family lipase [Sulfuriroseicoccus oceanibius]